MREDCNAPGKHAGAGVFCVLSLPDNVFQEPAQQRKDTYLPSFLPNRFDKAGELGRKRRRTHQARKLVNAEQQWCAIRVSLEPCLHAALHEARGIPYATFIVGGFAEHGSVQGS